MAYLRKLRNVVRAIVNRRAFLKGLPGVSMYTAHFSAKARAASAVEELRSKLIVNPLTRI